MPKYLPASALISSLMLLNAIFILLFFIKDKWVYQENITQNYTKSYLEGKLSLIEEIKKSDQELDSLCKIQKSKNIEVKHKNIIYQFHCQEIDLYVKGIKPTRKYVPYQKIDSHLHHDLIDKYAIKINSLSELPPNNESNPYIVIMNNDINDKLNNDFYGIIITDHSFVLRNGRQFYGVLYSSFQNKTNRYSTYSAKVVDHLRNRYNDWKYLPHSRNILKNEKTH